VDEDGDRVGELRYKAWGETRYASGSPNTDCRYTGQREEAGIGLYYYHARWYDTELSRFLSPDNLPLTIVNALEFDKYSYVLDSPVNNSDPSGNKPCDDENGCKGAVTRGVDPSPAPPIILTSDDSWGRRGKHARFEIILAFMEYYPDKWWSGSLPSDRE
jgi:RHS repeat-associated protein